MKIFENLVWLLTFKVFINKACIGVSDDLTVLDAKHIN